MLTLENFKQQIDPTILKRGLQYFESQAVETLEENEPVHWEAVVSGSENYEVEIVLKKKAIKSVSCDCPYDGGPICKHVVAVLYALAGQPTVPKVKSNKPKKLTFEELLLKIDLEELRSFVRDQHQGNRDFGNKFLLFFAEKDPSIDIAAKYEGMLQQLVRQHSSRGFMDYRSTFAFSKEVQPILDIASKALGQQNFRDALVIVQASCKIGLDVIQNCDDSAGNVSGILFQGIEVLGHIAQSKTVSPELLEQLYAYLNKSLRVKT